MCLDINIKNAIPLYWKYNHNSDLNFNINNEKINLDLLEKLFTKLNRENNIDYSFNENTKFWFISYKNIDYLIAEYSSIEGDSLIVNKKCFSLFGDKISEEIFYIQME